MNPMTLTGKKIVLGVTGGIAAYKSAALCSLLKKAGCQLRVVMTKHATEFVSPLTFEALSNQAVSTDMFADERPWDIQHISWAKWADVIVVAPATANILAKAATGLADDMLSTMLLATEAPVLFAPAMNSKMFLHPATQANMSLLANRPHIHFCMPTEGTLACGEEGIGKMQEPEAIAEALVQLLTLSSTSSEAMAPLAQKTILITSGPTREYIDPVRFISNPSSGKMGQALAQQALTLGAQHVDFVTGPVESACLPCGDATRLTVHPVVSAQEMYDRAFSLATEADIVIFAAAVSDYRVAHSSKQKMKTKNEAFPLTLSFIQNPDIAKAVSSRKNSKQFTVGFAAETHDIAAYAKEKLKAKNLDMIVANDVANSEIGFGSTNNEVAIYMATSDTPVYLSKADKQSIARLIYEEILKQLK